MTQCQRVLLLRIYRSETTGEPVPVTRRKQNDADKLVKAGLAVYILGSRGPVHLYITTAGMKKAEEIFDFLR